MWALIIIIFGSASTSVPMASREACVRAMHEIKSIQTGLRGSMCIDQKTGEATNDK